MKYGSYYQEFSNEVHKAFGCYLMWKAIRKKASSDNDVLIALNKNPLSWIMIRHSLQVTLFMTLGRIFDTDGGALSIDDLLKTCLEEIDIFSKERLRQRRIIENGGKAPDYLDEYIKGVDVIERKHFRELRKEVAKGRKVFERNYRPIRHKLFAHSEKDYLGRSDELWQQTNVEELEGLLWLLNDLKESLSNAYHNGRIPRITGREPDLAFYESDFNDLIERVKGT